MRKDEMKDMHEMKETYPLRDPIPKYEVRKIAASIVAVSTGTFRCPKRGEWYLSGATIEAYRAYSDMTEPYFIARLVIGVTIS